MPRGRGGNGAGGLHAEDEATWDQQEGEQDRERHHFEDTDAEQQPTDDDRGQPQKLSHPITANVSSRATTSVDIIPGPRLGEGISMFVERLPSGPIIWPKGKDTPWR